jgi:hypothetical protein
MEQLTQICPWTQMLSIDCDGPPHIDEVGGEDHMRWHIFELVRTGEIIDNGDDTYSVRD